MSALPPITAHSLEVQAAKTVVVFAVVATGLRLLGKRETSQLNVYDLAMLMALANAVQNAITGGKGNLAVGLVTSSVLVLVAWGVTKLIVRKPGLERALVGSPTILIHRGTILPGRLRGQGVSLQELQAAARGYGISDLALVHTCVLEVDGSISVIPYPDAGRDHSEHHPRPQSPDEPGEG
ncbi:MAG: putative rane protein [Actinobacteria bacterium]|nr:putative rane protein [Actinomycetota bacterium]